jgi:dihydroflavonol-4-reductase
MSLAEILAEVSRVTGRRSPVLRFPHLAILPVAAGAQTVARLTGREPFATVDGVKMARKKMFFSSARAVAELGYAPRPARRAIADAVAWFKASGYLE